MCGRFSLYNLPELINEYQLDFSDEIKPHYNIAPSQAILAIINDGGYHARQLRWGLIPFWSKAVFAGLINARAETVDQKPSFRQSFAKRRCLIPADGFYEWKKQEKGKQPYRITLKDRQVFAFAGLWETWTSPSGDTINSAAIITTEPNAAIRPIHNRMPVVLPKTAESVWLDGDADHQTLKSLLKPYRSEQMELYPISNRVNSARNDSPSVLEPVSGA